MLYHQIRSQDPDTRFITITQAAGEVLTVAVWVDEPGKKHTTFNVLNSRYTDSFGGHPDGVRGEPLRASDYVHLRNQVPRRVFSFFPTKTAATGGGAWGWWGGRDGGAVTGYFWANSQQYVLVLSEYVSCH